MPLLQHAVPARLRPSRVLRAGVGRTLPSLTGVTTTAPLVALTFDDGPDPRLTPGVLDVLEEHGAVATFLLVAEQVRQHPDLAGRVAAAGHEIGLHGDRHVDLRSIAAPTLYRALRRGRADVAAVTGSPVRWFRPPYGKQRAETVAAARAAGMRPVMWSTSAYDWKALTIPEQLAHVDPGLRPGAVVLLHDGAADEMEPLPPPPATQPALLDELLGRLDQRGLRPVGVSELCAAGRAQRAPWFEHWLHH